ncbi:MAG TPA: lytic transglycosylase domain-containing protein [Marmoricola sp.]|nr:lytic transglycosylase domain-containing protein [Marmoricola sp.]
MSLRQAVLASGVAVAATGIVVSSGVMADSAPADNAAAALTAVGDDGSEQLTQEALAEREQRASRSSADRRATADRTKVRALATANGKAVTRTEDLSVADPKSLASALMPKYGLNPSEFDCLDSLWEKESGWDIHADNPSSSAYGIPQALPGSKMASAGPNWEDSAETQIRWGLGYIRDRYGSACSAWGHSQANNWY